MAPHHIDPNLGDFSGHPRGNPRQSWWLPLSPGHTSLGHGGCRILPLTCALGQVQPLQAPAQCEEEGGAPVHVMKAPLPSQRRTSRRPTHASLAGQGPAPADHQADGALACAGRQQDGFPAGHRPGLPSWNL